MSDSKKPQPWAEEVAKQIIDCHKVGECGKCITQTVQKQTPTIDIIDMKDQALGPMGNTHTALFVVHTKIHHNWLVTHVYPLPTATTAPTTDSPGIRIVYRTKAHTFAVRVQAFHLEQVAIHGNKWNFYGPLE